jgi:hypothetical protein
VSLVGLKSLPDKSEVTGETTKKTFVGGGGGHCDGGMGGRLLYERNRCTSEHSEELIDKTVL